MKKILLFQMNGIAYDSTCFFSSCLGKALENAGIEVTWFDFRRQTMKDLEALCGQSFDAVIDSIQNCREQYWMTEHPS